MYSLILFTNVRWPQKNYRLSNTARKGQCKLIMAQSTSRIFSLSCNKLHEFLFWYTTVLKWFSNFSKYKNHSKNMKEEKEVSLEVTKDS